MKTQFEIAKKIAILAHTGQFRRDGVTPYITHPLAVADKVFSDYEKAVAVLHDAREDNQHWSSEMSILEGELELDVIAAVELLTKKTGQSYEEYLINIKANPLARRVKIVDMLHNLSDTPTLKQIRKYAKGLLFLTEELDTI